MVKILSVQNTGKLSNNKQKIVLDSDHSIYGDLLGDFPDSPVGATRQPGATYMEALTGFYYLRH